MTNEVLLLWQTKYSLAGTLWRLLLPYKGGNLKATTTDNGSEFAAHEWITGKLGVPAFFADAYSSWQKGAIENTNKLIRQYHPQENGHQSSDGQKDCFHTSENQQKTERETELFHA